MAGAIGGLVPVENDPERHRPTLHVKPLSVTFADYLMPTVRETPPMDVIIAEDAPSPLNALGLKGAGEAGVNAVGAAIASAIDDAIGKPGALTQLPVNPQRMKAMLRRR